MAAHPLDAGVRPARDSTALAGDPASLRQTMAQDGYLLVRDVVPREVASGLAETLTTVLRSAGADTPQDAGDRVQILGSQPQDLHTVAGGGVSSRAGTAGRLDVHADRDLFRKLYRLEALHRLPHHPALLDLACALLAGQDGDGDGDGDSDARDDGSGEILVHPHPALRVVFPQTEGPVGATPAHQDHLGMQGTTEAYTVWVALSPCPVEAGVLSVAEGSHLEGLRRYQPVAGARVACCDASDLEGRWVAADLEPGDVMTFHSLTVHRALPNRSGAVRLSVDARYQRVRDPVCRSTLRELHDLPWDELYDGWSEGAPRRYWEALPLHIAEFNSSLLS